MNANAKMSQNEPSAALWIAAGNRPWRTVGAVNGSFWLGIAALALGFGLSPLSVQAAVFGGDQRTPLPQSLRSVGNKMGTIFDPRSHSVCSAFCVAPNMIATAAHCLYRTAGETPLRLTDLKVRVNGSRDTSHIAGARKGTPELNVLSGSQHLNVHPPIDATRDWALVRLAKPLCKAGALKIAPRPVNDVMRLAADNKVYNVAYHRDLPKWQLMLGRPCRVKRSFAAASWPTILHDFTNPQQLLLHTCDTGPGSSGSPLLVEGANGPEVIGINVGTYVQSKVILLNGEVVHRFKADDVANTGVNAQAFADAFTAFRDADLLASYRDILRLQDALAARALYNGPRDGRYSDDLKSAIESFQRAAAMPVTGLATRPLLAAVVGESRLVTGKIPSDARTAASSRNR
jgi:Trypsin-like peptidase domain/Putative peptidoglycan binding domain